MEAHTDPTAFRCQAFLGSAADAHRAAVDATRHETDSILTGHDMSGKSNQYSFIVVLGCTQTYQPVVSSHLI
jgi:hypothetical protein